MLLDNLEKNITDTLQICSDFAQSYSTNIYLVGGVVRDLFLQQKTVDIDVCLEYDAIKFAKLLEEQNLVEILNTQEDLRTAKVLFKNGVVLDLASTRKEEYPKSSHLPVPVDFYCPLETDIKRRDFTINALAVSLNKEDFGEIKDFLNGLKDLENKKLKILHNKSFIDDPSRIIRALKYALRLNFTLEENTESLMQQYLSTVSNQDICTSRIMSELEQVFSFRPQIALQKFYEWHLEKLFALKEIYNIPNLEKIYKELKIKDDWFSYFAFIFSNSDKKEIVNFAQKLNFENWQKKILLDFWELKTTFSQTELSNFEIYKRFTDRQDSAIGLYFALTQDKNVTKFYKELSQIKIFTTGNDLISLGLTPSKSFKKILDTILDKKLNKELTTKEDEINFVKSHFLV